MRNYKKNIQGTKGDYWDGIKSMNGREYRDKCSTYNVYLYENVNEIKKHSE